MSQNRTFRLFFVVVCIVSRLTLNRQVQTENPNAMRKSDDYNNLFLPQQFRRRVVWYIFGQENALSNAEFRARKLRWINSYKILSLGFLFNRFLQLKPVMILDHSQSVFARERCITNWELRFNKAHVVSLPNQVIFFNGPFHLVWRVFFTLRSERQTISTNFIKQIALPSEATLPWTTTFSSSLAIFRTSISRAPDVLTNWLKLWRNW